jgi:hypothetical protein
MVGLLSANDRDILKEGRVIKVYWMPPGSPPGLKIPVPSAHLAWGLKKGSFSED